LPFLSHFINMIISPNSQASFSVRPNQEVNQAARNRPSETNAAVQKTDHADSATPLQKSPEEQSQIQELRNMDREVRTHEQAHQAAAGGLSKGGASFEFVLGPDGQRYAVSGEVQIDTSGVPGDPEATLEKAQQIQRAALAPAQPSAQDRSVAIAAAAMAAEARVEIINQQSEGVNKVVNNDSGETSLQRITSNLNDTYRAIPDVDSQRTAAVLVDLVA
jgi:hypothetical protein